MDEKRPRGEAPRFWRSRPTLEGAGVHLYRAFGFQEVPRLDPFLLLDDFHSENPEDYRRGFPWHPHRGIETITYILDGDVEHRDSMGNQGVISAGDVQWMTAGSGIIHQEMPQGDRKGRMRGFQLWANLPARQKMMEPRYREVAQAEIPEVRTPEGALLRVVAGSAGGVEGPVREIVTEPEFLDVALPPGKRFTRPVPAGSNLFAYVFEGEGLFGEPSGEGDRGAPERRCSEGTLLHYAPGASVAVRTEERPVRFLLVSGKPLGEPVAWYGPIVMNTRKELEMAFREYEEGAFIKSQRR